MYSNDYDDVQSPFSYELGDDYIAWWGARQPKTSTAISWRFGLLQPYIGGLQHLTCRSSGGVRGALSAPMDYGVNIRAVGAAFALVEVPAETLILADSAGWTWDDGVPVVTQTPMLTTPCLTAGCVHARHTGAMATAGWLDGHISSKRVTHNERFQGPNGLFNDLIKKANLGMITRGPMEYESGTSYIPSVASQYYYFIQKPHSH
jgi:prepilin-type processing-associated H-X9-DG protein